MSAIYQDGKWYVSTGLEVHSGFTPIGTIISVMGTTAPMNYLACNGQVVNISDYPELALYFETQFGSKNKFGGDGTTTFGIPDLRGEFLRGTGTNGHTDQGSGADVGTHQDATEQSFVQVDATGNSVFVAVSQSINNTWTSEKLDSRPKFTQTRNIFKLNFSRLTDSYGSDTPYTSRPTNTSVLYCIATKNIFMDAGSNYSTEEQVVGTWVDGKPIYQKTLNYSLNSSSDWQQLFSLNEKEIKNVFGYVKKNSGDFVQIGIGDYRPNDYTVNWATWDGNFYLALSKGSGEFSVFITIQYTKTTD